MSEPNSNALDLSRKLLRVLIVLNPIVGGLILALLIATLVAGPTVMEAIGVAPDNHKLFNGMRVIAALGVASIPFTHVVLSRLLAIVDTVRVSDPFVQANAVRLQTIAWAVVGLEVLHLAIGAIAAGVSTKEAPLDLDWNFSLTRWIAVLLLFVLARVFEQGARMREDLAATV